MSRSTSLTSSVRESWLKTATRNFATQMYDKFLAGAKEHGGDLGDIPNAKLIAHIEEEALDTALYTAEMRRRNSPVEATALKDGERYVVRHGSNNDQWAVLQWNAKNGRFEDFGRGYLTVPFGQHTAFHLPS